MIPFIILLALAITLWLVFRWSQAKSQAHPTPVPKDGWETAARSESFEMEVVGESFRNDDGSSRQQIISKLHEGDAVHFVREPNNPYDQNAILLVCEGGGIGYAGRDAARKLAPLLDAGGKYQCNICSIAGGTPKKPSRGVWLRVNVARD